MITAGQFEKLKNKVDNLKTQRDKAKGSLATVMGRLKDEFGCESIQDAEELLTELKESVKQHEEELEKLYEKFEDEFGERL